MNSFAPNAFPVTRVSVAVSEVPELSCRRRELA